MYMDSGLRLTRQSQTSDTANNPAAHLALAAPMKPALVSSSSSNIGLEQDNGALGFPLRTGLGAWDSPPPSQVQTEGRRKT